MWRMICQCLLEISDPEEPYRGDHKVQTETCTENLYSGIVRVNEERTDMTFWCARSEASFIFQATFRVSTKGPMESCEGKGSESGSDAQEEAVSKLKPKE